MSFKNPLQGISLESCLNPLGLPITDKHELCFAIYAPKQPPCLSMFLVLVLGISNSLLHLLLINMLVSNRQRMPLKVPLLLVCFLFFH